MIPPSGPPAPLAFHRRLKAPVARVYAAWTEPAELARWFGPGEWEVARAEADVRPGGAYRLHYHLPADGTRMQLGGVYQEVVPLVRLVFTWRVEEMPIDLGSTVVAVVLEERDGETELRITHGGFKVPEFRESHGAAWAGLLDSLAALVEGA